MLRRILSVIAGLLAGFAIIFIGDGTTHKLHPPPPGLMDMDRAAFGDYVMAIPDYVLVIMFIFWLLSSFLGGMVTTAIARPNWKGPALVTGAILMAAALTNLAMIHHPTWMIIGTILGYLPAAYLGGYLVRGRKPIS
jgi:hypothetical protein